MSIFNADIDEFVICIHAFFSGSDHTHNNGKYLWDYVKKYRKIYKKPDKRYVWAKIHYVDKDVAMDKIREGYSIEIIKPAKVDGCVIYKSFFSLWFNIGYYPYQTYNMHKNDFSYCEHHSNTFVFCNLEGDSMLFKITEEEYDMILDIFKQHYKTHLNALKSRENQ